MASLNAGLVLTRGDAADMVAQVQQAEQRGVGTVWTTVGGPTADSVTALAAAAYATERIVLGTAVAPTYPRHPITLAAQAIAISDLAPGRFRLGIGTSHRPTIEGAYGIPMGKPHAHLREYLAILRDLLWAGTSAFSGEYFTVDSRLPDGVMPPKVPILVSALRPNAFRLAGELADGAISWMTPIDYLVETALPQLRDGAEAAGRPQPPLLAHVPVAISTDREAVRTAFHAQFGIYGRIPFYVAMFEAAGYPVTGGGEMPNRLLDTLAVSGSPEQVRSRLRAIRDRGIDELLVSLIVVEDRSSELEALSHVLADPV